MILNLLMFFGAFMVAKNTPGRLLAAGGIGIIKGAVYFQATQSIWLGALLGLVFFSLVLGIIACLHHLITQGGFGRGAPSDGKGENPHQPMAGQ